MNRRLLINISYLAIVQICNYIVPFFVLVHLTKTLGIEIYGVIAFAQGINVICSVVVDFGFGLSATNKISIHRANKNYVAKIIGSVCVIKFIFFVICCIGIVWYSIASQKYENYNLVFILFLIPLGLQSLAIDWFFQGVEKMHFFAIVSVLSKITFGFMVIFLIKDPSDYLLVPLFNGVSLVFPLILSAVFVYKLGYTIKFPRVFTICYCIKFTLQFFISRIAVAVYMNSAVVILGLVAQPAVVGVYSMAEQLYKAMQSVLSPMATASYPYMAKVKAPEMMLKLFVVVLGLSISGACFGYFFAPTIIRFVFDTTWLASVPTLNIFFIAIVIHSAAIMAGYPLAALVGKLKVANFSVVTGAVVYLSCIGLVLFFDAISPANLALVMLISELSVLLHRSILLFPPVIRQLKSASAIVSNRVI